MDTRTMVGYNRNIRLVRILFDILHSFAGDEPLVSPVGNADGPTIHLDLFQFAENLAALVHIDGAVGFLQQLGKLGVEPIRPSKAVFAVKNTLLRVGIELYHRCENQSINCLAILILGGIWGRLFFENQAASVISEWSTAISPAA